MKSTIDLKLVSASVLILGMLYAATGILEVLVLLLDIGWIRNLIPADVFGGMALLVIGTVYLFGVRNLQDGGVEGLAFALVGGMLSGIFGILYLMMMGAEGMMYLLGETETFSVLAGIRPAVWLFVLSLPLAYYLKRGDICGA
jgi:hypothetical protein